MKKFKCVVTRTDEYIIEIDENKINQEWMDNFSNHFYEFKTLEEHAQHIAQYRARFPEDTLIEGYGIPLVNGDIPLYAIGNLTEKGINIRIISEDEDCEVEVDEL